MCSHIAHICVWQEHEKNSTWTQTYCAYCWNTRSRRGRIMILVFYHFLIGIVVTGKLVFSLRCSILGLRFHSLIKLYGLYWVAWKITCYCFFHVCDSHIPYEWFLNISCIQHYFNRCKTYLIMNLFIVLQKIPLYIQNETLKAQTWWKKRRKDRNKNREEGHSPSVFSPVELLLYTGGAKLLNLTHTNTNTQFYLSCFVYCVWAAGIEFYETPWRVDQPLSSVSTSINTHTHWRQSVCVCVRVFPGSVSALRNEDAAPLVFSHR